MEPQVIVLRNNGSSCLAYDLFFSLRSEKRDSLSAANPISLPSSVASRLVGAVVAFLLFSFPNYVLQVRARKIPSTCIRASQLGSHQIRAPQLGSRQPGVRQVRPLQVLVPRMSNSDGRSCSGLCSLSLLLPVFWFSRKDPNRIRALFCRKTYRKICSVKCFFIKKTLFSKKFCIAPWREMASVLRIQYTKFSKSESAISTFERGSVHTHVGSRLRARTKRSAFC